MGANWRLMNLSLPGLLKPDYCKSVFLYFFISVQPCFCVYWLSVLLCFCVTVDLYYCEQSFPYVFISVHLYLRVYGFLCFCTAVQLCKHVSLFLQTRIYGFTGFCVSVLLYNSVTVSLYFCKPVLSGSRVSVFLHQCPLGALIGIGRINTTSQDPHTRVPVFTCSCVYGFLF